MPAARLNLKSNYINTPSGGSFTVSTPGETPTAGEQMVALVVFANTMTLTPPAGWATEATGTLDASRNYGIYSHVSAAAESPSTWTYTGTAGPTAATVSGMQNVASFRIGTVTVASGLTATAAAMTPVTGEKDLLVVVAGAVPGFQVWSGTPSGGPPNVGSEDAGFSATLSFRTYSGLESAPYTLTPGTPTPTYTMTDSGGGATSSVAFQVLFAHAFVFPLRLFPRNDDLDGPRLAQFFDSASRSTRLGGGDAYD